MKKKVFALLFAVTVFMGALQVEAASVSTFEEFKAALTSEDSEITIQEDMVISENVTLDGKQMIIAPSKTLTIDNAILTITNQDVGKNANAITAGANSKIVLQNQGILEATGNKQGAILRVAKSIPEADWPTMDVTGEGSAVYIHDNSGIRGGIDWFGQITVTDKAALIFENNSGAYASNTASIYLEDSVISSTGNMVGLTSSLVTKGNSAIEVTGNGLFGIVLKPGSNIGGNTGVVVTGNNTSNDTERGTDIAIAGDKTNPVILSENAVVIVDNIRNYYDKWGSVQDIKGNVIINGDAAMLLVAGVLTDNTDDTKLVSPLNGFLGTDTTLTAYGTVAGELTVEDGDTIIISKDADVSNFVFTVQEGGTIKNESDTPVVIKTESGDLTIEANSTVTVAKEEIKTSTTETEEVKNPDTADINITMLILTILLGSVAIGAIVRNRFAKVK